MDNEVDDLDAERKAAVEAVNSLPLTRTWAFEYTPASADRVVDTYLSKVEQCEILILIAASEITPAVRNEYVRATTCGKRRLVFVKDGCRRSPELQQWLSERQDVKYGIFSTASDLAKQVQMAVVEELIKGYRLFRLRDQDFAGIARSVRSSPVTFCVRTIDPDELPFVTQSFPELAELYPNFEEWVDKKRAAINRGESEAHLARHGEENAGFALTSEKGNHVRKISTLYVLPRFQGQGVGWRLLYGVVSKAAQDDVEKLYVTVSEERRDSLEALLLHYGFYVEGVSARRYRSYSCEWVWAKRMLYGRVDEEYIPQLVKRILLEERGLAYEEIDQHMYRVESRFDFLGVESQRSGFVLGISTGPEPLADLERVETERQKRRMHAVLVSANPVASTDSCRCIDSLELETMFFPLYIERGIGGLVIPIREAFAEQLIPMSTQQQFLTPSRIQLRTDNVYYRYPSLIGSLGRGTPLFFLETQRRIGRSVLLGEAKLMEAVVDTPEELLARFGNIGVYSLDEIRQSVGKRGGNAGAAEALKFDWYREFSAPITVDQLRVICPKFDPTTARRIPGEAVWALRRLANWNVTPISFQ